MRAFLLVFIFAINLTGCVGFNYSGNGKTYVSDSNFSSVPFNYKTSPPARDPDRKNPDGSEMFIVEHEWKWCGLTVWAIIPLPLWLPVCSNHLEATYMNGKITLVASQQPTFTGYWCGPLVPIMGIGGGSGGFCSKIEYF